jgi:hypothetical protein
MDPTDDEAVEVDRAAYTASLGPTDQLKGWVPPPITRRADQLYELLKTRARNARKGDFIAALVQAAPADAEALRKMLSDYEDARVWQTLVGETRRTGRVKLPAKRGRGRPSG